MLKRWDREFNMYLNLPIKDMVSPRNIWFLVALCFLSHNFFVLFFLCLELCDFCLEFRNFCLILCVLFFKFYNSCLKFSVLILELYVFWLDLCDFNLLVLVIKIDHLLLLILAWRIVSLRANSLISHSWSLY